MVYRQGNIVTITYSNDVQGNIPTGDMGIFFTLPEEYRPSYSVVAFAGPGINIQVKVDPYGKVNFYNYGDNINGPIAVRFTLTYLTA